MDRPGAESARYLAANGTREWKNKMMVKARRETASLEVMEYVVGDEHTFDIWVQYTAPNGKIKAVRPKLVAWMDVKTRTIIGDVLCVDANSQTLKESLVKMIYSKPGGVPKILHIDNGKDYTGETMTGQSRKNRKIDFDFDAETIGFYQSIGIQEVGRSLPYQPWDKSIERFFSTVCSKFSKWFESYTGTLTGSKTYAKRNKDIDKMLERGELLTMEEFFDLWLAWKDTKYHTREHRGLKENHEKWVTPIELFENGSRYMKAAPPREYAAMREKRRYSEVRRHVYGQRARQVHRSKGRRQVGHRRRDQALRLRQRRPEDMRGGFRRGSLLRSTLFASCA